jgi:tetratricopeptide (TPR) repeat protein
MWASQPTNFLTDLFFMETRAVLSLNRPKRSVAGAVSLLVASTIFTVSTQAAETAHTPLVLTAYENGAGGESLMAGKYTEALAEIAKAKPQDSLSMSAKATNLCVAYVATKQITEAKSACDMALRLAKSDRLSSNRYSPGSARENAYLAVAYANRAVVSVLARDSEKAKSDLARAQVLAPRADFVVKNVAAVSNPRSTIAQAEIRPSR